MRKDVAISWSIAGLLFVGFLAGSIAFDCNADEYSGVDKAVYSHRNSMQLVQDQSGRYTVYMRALTAHVR